MSRRRILLLSCLFIISLFAVILSAGIQKQEDLQYRTLFQLSLKDMDFSEEITGRLEEKAFTAGSVREASGGENPNRLRSWGVVRQGNHKTPLADPGAPDMLKKYQGIYVANTEKSVVYLTFDEGYENGYTGDILDVLLRQNVKALFFITGPYLNQQEALVRRMVEEGHVVGNHTVGHFSLPTLTDEKMEKEVMELDKLFYEKFNKQMIFLRPPKGEYSAHSLEVTSSLGYINVFWSFAYNDWDRNNQKGWEHAYNKVMTNLHNGSILLLHAVSSDNAQALERIIIDTRKMGYEFGHVMELEALARGEEQ